MTTGSVSRHLVFCRLPWRGPTVLSWKGCWLFLAISTLCRSECYVVVVFLHSFYRQDRGVLWRQLSRHSDYYYYYYYYYYHYHYYYYNYCYYYYYYYYFYYYYCYYYYHYYCYYYYYYCYY